MTLKEMFIKAHSLPVDQYGLFKIDGEEILHIYHSGSQINVIERGEPAWNIIDYGNKFDVIPVADGRSRWEAAVPYQPSVDVNMLPERIKNAFKLAGIIA